MANDIKYGIIGAGHLGNYHAQQLLKISSVQLVGVYDISSKHGLLLAKQYKIKSFSSVESLLHACDAVSIATPASSHFLCAKLALKNNCHVFIEKPFTKNISEAKKLIQLQTSYNLKIQVGHIERFNSAFSTFIKTNPRPLFIEAHRLCLYNNRGLDVDVILDLMIHDIDLVITLINSNIKNISASGAAVLSNSIDIANARLDFENGATVNLTANRISLKQMRKMRVFEKNTYSALNFQSQTVNSWFVNRSGVIKEKDFLVVPVNALFEELNLFIVSILNNSPVAVGGKDALEALIVASKIQKIIEKIKK